MLFDGHCRPSLPRPAERAPMALRAVYSARQGPPMKETESYVRKRFQGARDRGTQGLEGLRRGGPKTCRRLRSGDAPGSGSRSVAGRSIPSDMPPRRPSLCITCGLDAGSGRTLNRMNDGRACPTCADRLLDMLPPVFPGFGHLLEPRTTGRGEVRKGGSVPKNFPGSTKRARRGRKRGSK